MKRTPASNRMPVQLGVLLNNRSSVSAPLNCLHHHLQNQLQDSGNGNVPGSVPGDYETQPFDMLGISSLPLDIDLGTPSSPDGLQPSMMDPTLESENFNVNRSQASLSHHNNHHLHQSHNSSNLSQLSGDCMPESSQSHNICNSSHIHRNSYSDSNSPSVVSSLSSSCSVSPQSTDLSFGILSTYQAQNTGSSRTSSISQPQNIKPADICESLLSVPSNSATEPSLSNTTLSSSFPEPFVSGPLTNPLESSSSISSVQKQKQQKPQQNNSNNFMIFDFETTSNIPPMHMASNNVHNNGSTSHTMNSNGNTTHITSASNNVINSINNMNNRSNIIGNMAKLAGGQPPKPSLPLSSTAMLISTQQQHQQQAKALLDSLSPPIPTSLQIGTPPERNLCTMPGLTDCVGRNNGAMNCGSSNGKMNNSLGIGNNHVCVNGGNNGNPLLTHSGMVCTVNGVNSAAASHSKSHCKVCGDTAIGKNFGVLTCGSCKIFFRRNCNEDKCKLLCRNNNNCVITKSNRRNCARCRLQKCRDLGMKLKQSRHSREIRRDISADDSDGQHCCPSYSAHCSLHNSECISGSDCCQIPDDLPSLISEDEARRRCEAKQFLIDNESDLLDYVIRLEGEEEYERDCEGDYSDVEDVANDDVIYRDTEVIAGVEEPAISDTIISSLTDTLTIPLPVVESLGQTVEEEAPVNGVVELVDNCVQEQTPCCNDPFVETPIAQQVQTNNVADVPLAPSLVLTEEKHTFEHQDSDSDVEEAVPDRRLEVDFDSADSINLSHQMRVATFLKNASNQDWENYKEILGETSKWNENGCELPEDFEQRMIEFYQRNRKRHRNDVELIKAEARHLPSKIDHQITELCQMTSFIRINMGLEYSACCEGSAHVPALVNKELERINGLNKSCQMIDIKPKDGQKDFSISDSLKQGIFYADKSFKLLEKFWRLNPELKEMIMINEKAFDTRKKNLLHMLYHLRGVYNFDDNQDAWLVPSEMEAKTVTYVKLTMFNQSIKKEMTTIHKKYIDSFPKLWREDLTIFNLMTFLLFFRSFDELRSQYKCEKMRYYSVMYLLKRYLENLYGDEQEALSMLHRVLTLIKDLKWLCTECLNACTHSFNLDVLQEVAPNYADLLRTEEEGQKAQLGEEPSASGSGSCAFSHCKKARCEG